MKPSSFKIYQVTCPGVWLCSKSKVALSFKLFGIIKHSKFVPPQFPLRFEQTLTFSKVFQNPAYFIQEEILPRRLFQVNLIQQTPGSCHPVTLCHFVISLSELSQYAQPVESFNPNLEHGWVDLLLQPTRNFPGILAPKLELCAGLHLEEIINGQFSRVIKMSPVQFRKDKKNKDTRSHICQRTVCHVSNLHQLPIKKSQTFASKRITGKRDNNLKKVWTEPKQSARSVFTPSNNSKRFATLKKAISCSSIEEYGRVPCSVCQCDICAKFDYVFYGDNKMSVGDGNFIKRCTPCDMCIRTCQSDDRSIPVVKSHASPLTTPKSKKKFRDESSFATYARAISDVCLNQPSLQKEDNVRNRTSNSHSYPVSQSEPTNVYYTHQWKHINDLNRSSRYLFYSNLENFYRQLYLRARERTIAYSS